MVLRTKSLRLELESADGGRVALGPLAPGGTSCLPVRPEEQGTHRPTEKAEDQSHA